MVGINLDTDILIKSEVSSYVNDNQRKTFFSIQFLHKKSTLNLTFKSAIIVFTETLKIQKLCYEDLSFY